MPASESVTYCQCCGNNRPASGFAPGAITCGFCVELRPDDITRSTLVTVQRELAITQHTKEGRKAARIAAKLAKYAQTGKRCTACHHYKPAAAFNRCAAQSDGLQPICRGCNVLRVESIKAAGLAQWHTIRAALRASSPEGK